MTGAFRVPESFDAFLPIRVPRAAAQRLARTRGWTTAVGMLRALGSDPSEAAAVRRDAASAALSGRPSLTSPLARALAPALRLYQSPDASAAPTIEALSYPLSVARAACRLRRDAVAQAALDAAVSRDAGPAAAILAACWPGDTPGAEVRLLVAGASRLAEQRVYEATSAGRALRVGFPTASLVRVLLVGPEVDPAAYGAGEGGDDAFGVRWRHAGWRGPAGSDDDGEGTPCPVLVSAARSTVEAALSPAAGALAPFFRDAPGAATAAASAPAVVRLGAVHHGGFGNRWPSVRRGWAAGLAALASWGEPVVFTCANRVEAVRGELAVQSRLLGARVLGAGLCPSRALTLVSGDPEAEMRRLGLPSRDAIVAASLDCSVANYFVYATQGLEAPPTKAAAPSAASVDARCAAVRRTACRVAVKAGLVAITVGDDGSKAAAASLGPAGEAAKAAGSLLHVAAPWAELLASGASLPPQLAARVHPTGRAAVPAEAVVAAVHGGASWASAAVARGKAGWAGEALMQTVAEIGERLRAGDTAAPAAGAESAPETPGWARAEPAVGTTRLALRSGLVRMASRALDARSLAESMASLEVKEGLA